MGEEKDDNIDDAVAEGKTQPAARTNTHASARAACFAAISSRRSGRRLAHSAPSADSTVNLPSPPAGANRRHLADLPETKNTRELPIHVRNPLIARFIRESERCINS